MPGLAGVQWSHGKAPMLRATTLSDTHAGTTADVSINFLLNGKLELGIQFVGISSLPEWWGAPYEATGINVGLNYEIRLTVSSGSAPNRPGDPPINTWLTFSRGWALQRDIIGSSSGDWLVEIRSAASGVVLASAPYHMSVTRT